MIDHKSGKIVYVCDEGGCGERLDTGVSDALYANEIRKDAGWMAYRMGRKYSWMNVCPECQKVIANG